MGWRTGSQTYGVHFIASLTKTSDHVRNISPSYDFLTIAQRDASAWLLSISPTTTTVKNVIDTIRNTRTSLCPTSSRPTSPQHRYVTSGIGRPWCQNSTTKNYFILLPTPAPLTGGLHVPPLHLRNGTWPLINGQLQPADVYVSTLSQLNNNAPTVTGSAATQKVTTQ